MLTEPDTKEVDTGPPHSCRDVSDVLAVLSAGGFNVFVVGQTEAGGGRVGTEDELRFPVDGIRNAALFPGCAGSINLQKVNRKKSFDP